MDYILQPIAFHILPDSDYNQEVQLVSVLIHI